MSDIVKDVERAKVLFAIGDATTERERDELADMLPRMIAKIDRLQVDRQCDQGRRILAHHARVATAVCANSPDR